jgi:hypothetical protein
MGELIKVLTIGSSIVVIAIPLPQFGNQIFPNFVFLAHLW